MLWGRLLDQKISRARDSQLVIVQLTTQLKSNFRLESDVNYGHTWLPQLKWRILFSISKSVEANIGVTTY